MKETDQLRNLMESVQLNEYGDVDWVWFTRNKKEFVIDWVKQGLTKHEAMVQLREIAEDGHRFEDHWHPLLEMPDNSDTQAIQQEIKSRPPEEDQEYEEYEGGEGLGEEISVLVIISRTEGRGVSCHVTDIDGAIINRNTAAWYGDETSWY